MKLSKVGGGCLLVLGPLLLFMVSAFLGALPPEALLSIGDGLGRLWVAYGLFLFVVTLFPVSLLVLFILVVSFFVRREVQWGVRPVELALQLVSGLLNPLAYLLILKRTSGDAELFVDVTPSPLDGLALWLLGAMWLFRLVPERVFEKLNVEGKRLAGGLLVGAILCVMTYLFRDLISFSPGQPGVFRNLTVQGLRLSGVSYLANVLCLYLIPVVLALRVLRSLWQGEGSLEASGFVLRPGRVGRALISVVLTLLVASLVLLHLRPSPWGAQEWVLSKREMIQDSAQRLGTDPQLLAALLYELQRREGSVIGSSVETLLMGAWLTDRRNHMLLADSLNISIGSAQIKPVTAQTALFLVETIGGTMPLQYPGKEYRGLPSLGPSWRLSPKTLAHMDLEARALPDKNEVVAELLDDESAIELCALLLELYALQWEQANPAWSLRQKPEILATLYQLGFERSEPKENPTAIPFGEAVRQAMEQPWIQESF